MTQPTPVSTSSLVNTEIEVTSSNEQHMPSNNRAGISTCNDEGSCQITPNSSNLFEQTPPTGGGVSSNDNNNVSSDMTTRTSNRYVSDVQQQQQNSNPTSAPPITATNFLHERRTQPQLRKNRRSHGPKFPRGLQHFSTQSMQHLTQQPQHNHNPNVGNSSADDNHSTNELSAAFGLLKLKKPSTFSTSVQSPFNPCQTAPIGNPKVVLYKAGRVRTMFWYYDNKATTTSEPTSSDLPERQRHGSHQQMRERANPSQEHDPPQSSAAQLLPSLGQTTVQDYWPSQPHDYRTSHAYDMERSWPPRQLHNVNLSTAYQTTAVRSTNTACLICEKEPAEFHYNIRSCEACARFLRYSVQYKREYSCVKGGTCVINQTQRKYCYYCRFKKCMELGMTLQVRTDRRLGGRSSGNNCYEVSNQQEPEQQSLFPYNYQTHLMPQQQDQQLQEWQFGASMVAVAHEQEQQPQQYLLQNPPIYQQHLQTQWSPHHHQTHLFMPQQQEQQQQPPPQPHYPIHQQHHQTQFFMMQQQEQQLQQEQFLTSVVTLAHKLQTQLLCETNLTFLSTEQQQTMHFSHNDQATFSQAPLLEPQQLLPAHLASFWDPPIMSAEGAVHSPAGCSSQETTSHHYDYAAFGAPQQYWAHQPSAASQIHTAFQETAMQAHSHFVNDTIFHTAGTNPSNIVHTRQISYEHALCMIKSLIKCDAMEDTATLCNITEFLEDESDINLKLGKMGESIVHKLFSWSSKLPFYFEIPGEIYKNILKNRWGEILILTATAYQVLHRKRNPSSSHSATSTHSGHSDSGSSSLPFFITHSDLVHKEDPEFIAEVNAHLATLQTGLTILMRQPFTLEHVKIDLGHLVEKLTKLTIIFRRIKLKMEEYVCLKVYMLLDKEVEVERIQQLYIQVLQAFLQRSSPQNPQGRLNELLSLIPEIQAVTSAFMQSKMFSIILVLTSVDFKGVSSQQTHRSW